MRKENLPPCSLRRHTVSDEYSTLTMQAHVPPPDRISLRGAWKGTCNPSVRCPLLFYLFSRFLKFISTVQPSGLGTASCRVDLVVHGISGAFRLVVSACPGYGVPNFAEGVIEEFEPSLPLDYLGSIVSDMHRRAEISWAHGLPYGSRGAKSFARSVLWTIQEFWMRMCTSVCVRVFVRSSQNLRVYTLLVKPYF